MSSINLIPAPRRLAAARRRRLRGWVVVCLAFGALLLLACEVCHVVWGGERRALDAGIDATADQIKQSSHAIQTLCRELADVQWKLDSCRAVGKQPNWGIPLALLAEKLSEDVVLERCELDAAKEPAGETAAEEPGEAQDGSLCGRFVFRVSGFGRSQTAVSQFVLRLEKSKLFDRVKLIKTNRQEFLSGKAVVFQLECLLEGRDRSRDEMAKDYSMATVSR